VNNKIECDDPVFVNFRRKLEDAVTVAINSGIKVSASLQCNHCPLGCINNSVYSRPNGAQARRAADWIDITPSMAPTAFAAGFDGHAAQLTPEITPYYKLGKLYKERFP
jgi:hypothetical protein